MSNHLSIEDFEESNLFNFTDLKSLIDERHDIDDLQNVLVLASQMYHVKYISFRQFNKLISLYKHKLSLDS